MPGTTEPSGVGGAGVGAVAAAAGQRATELLRQTTMRCGGCGAKVGATTLTQAPGGDHEGVSCVGVNDEDMCWRFAGVLGYRVDG